MKVYLSVPQKSGPLNQLEVAAFTVFILYTWQKKKFQYHFCIRSDYLDGLLFLNYLLQNRTLSVDYSIISCAEIDPQVFTRVQKRVQFSFPFPRSAHLFSQTFVITLHYVYMYLAYYDVYRSYFHCQNDLCCRLLYQEY